MAGTTTEYVGNVCAKVLLTRKVQQYILPAQREIDLNVSNFASGLGYNPLDNNNLYVDQDLGVVTVAHANIHRSNFIVNSADVGSTDKRLTELISNGALAGETLAEVKKRVFRLKPTYWQYLKKYKGSKIIGDYFEPWESNVLPDQTRQSNSPELKEYHFQKTESENPSLEIQESSWIYQTNSNPNTEWCLEQESGLFTNQSFWVHIRKHASSQPINKDPNPIKEAASNVNLDRYSFYGKDEARALVGQGYQMDFKSIKKVTSFISFTIGDWVPSEDGLSRSGYEIVFPIDGQPFIYDYSGDKKEVDDPKTPGAKISGMLPGDGFIANIQTDPSWILRKDLTDFSVKVFVARGKIKITSSYSNVSWIFPGDVSTLNETSTKTRYENLVIPAAKVKIRGRGFAFLFSFNPLEFKADRRDLPNLADAFIRYAPIQDRGDIGAVWTDIEDRDETNLDCNFLKMPFDKNNISGFTNQGTGGNGAIRGASSNKPNKCYGFDYVDENQKQHYNRNDNFTSMMIALGNGESSIKQEIVYVYTRVATDEQDNIPPQVDFNYSAANLYGYDYVPVVKTSLFINRVMYISLRCKAPTIGPYTDNEDGGDQERIGRQYASPIVWRVKAMLRMPRMINYTPYDITNLVSGMSYNSNCSDLTMVRQNFSVNIIVPKDYGGVYGGPQGEKGFKGYGIADKGTKFSSRDNLLSLLMDGVNEIEVWLGWFGGTVRDPALADPPRKIDSTSQQDFSIDNVGSGKMIRVFTGITKEAKLNETYALDTVTLECVDKMEILDGQAIIQQYFYDGMSVARAFLHICQLTGLPEKMFGVESISADNHILPQGPTFQEPAVTFQMNTSLLEAVKTVADYFQHIIRITPAGKIVLGDISENDTSSDAAMRIIDEIPITSPHYDFYIDGTLAPNPFQRAYESSSADKGVLEHANQMNIQSTDRRDGSIFVDSTAYDQESVEDPDSPNFIGYMKPFNHIDPAFGEVEYARRFRELMRRRIFQSPVTLRFSTFGRPTIRPLDIVGVYHTQPINLPYVTKGDFVHQSNKKYLKYRVMSVSGTIDPKDKLWSYKLTLELNHI